MINHPFWGTPMTLETTWLSVHGVRNIAATETQSTGFFTARNTKTTRYGHTNPSGLIV